MYLAAKITYFPPPINLFLAGSGQTHLHVPQSPPASQES